MVQVKCDETKPACGRCTTTGRKCDGYASPDIQNKTPTADGTALVMAEPSRGPAVCSINASAGEMLGLEFFCVKLAPSMGMYFDADFWKRSVVQASVAEPAVRHAVVAMGALAW